MAGASVSVVVPAYRAWRTLPAVLDALAPQVEAKAREAILVTSSPEWSGDAIAARWPWLRVVALEERTLPGRARNLGVAAASGELLAFLDADAIPAPDWLDRLLGSLTPELDAVAGAVLNGTPASIVGTAAHLLEFSEWLPGRRGTPLHAATCNLLVRRSAFDREGRFPEDVWPGEDTILSFRIARSGGLALGRSARVRHLNRTGAAEFVRHQHRLGVAYRAVCEAVPYPHRWTARPAAAPLAAALRLVALGQRLTGRDRVRALLLLPVVAVGLCAWAVGVAVAGRRR